MLNLHRHITLDDDTIGALNLTDRFDEHDLAAIGEEVWDGYDKDERGRSKWIKRTEAAMDLALQLQKAKTFPWPDCSNVAFPLVTIASMQWHSRAYPVLLNGPDVVKCRVIGRDVDGSKTERAERISKHMSYQLLEEDQPWEEQHDRGLLTDSIVGTIFKKSYFSPDMSHNVSELVMAKDLVLNYYAKSVEDCARKTHTFPMSRNEIYTRVKRKVFRNVLNDGWFQGPPPVQDDAQPNHQGVRIEMRTGVSKPQPADAHTPFTFLEQHVDLDLDGDGYAEPYIVTIAKEHHVPLRIVTRFEPSQVERAKTGKEIVRIQSLEYFTKYGFIPSPDGSIYDIGFGVLLGPLNESTNSIINQLIDAGTMATTAGGFLGRGVKIRGGQYEFRPFGWNRVDTIGGDLKDNIFPLPVREPSAVLFQLLGLIIDYTNRISGSTDVNVGENPGQNTPKYNMQAMQAEGQKVFSAIFKRQWRSMKEEFRKLWILNTFYLPDKATKDDSGIKISREDYMSDPRAIRPAADPDLVSDGMKSQQSVIVKQSSMQTAGYDKDAVERMFLKAHKVDQIDVIFPGSKKIPPTPHPKIQVEQMKNQAEQMKLRANLLEKLLELQDQRELLKAQIDEMKARTAEILSGIQMDKATLALETFEAQVNALVQTDEAVRANIDQIIKQLGPMTAEQDQDQGQGQGPQQGGRGAQSGGVPSMAGPSGDQGGAAGPEQAPPGV